MGEQVQVSQQWELLGNRFYRKVEIYKMAWYNPDDPTHIANVNLEGHLVAVGSFGGPIAITRDPSEITEVRGVAKSTIDIYAASGVKLAAIPWDKLVGGTGWTDSGAATRVLALGWSDKERLVVCTADGSLLMYSVQGEFLYRISLPSVARDHGVKEMKMCPGGAGLVVLTNNNVFCSVSNLDRNGDSPRVWKEAASRLMEYSPEDTTILSWTPMFNERSIEVLLACNRNLYVASAERLFDPGLDTLQLDHFTAMAVSANGKYVALFNSDKGRIWVVSADLKDNITQFEVQTSVSPRQLIWCGSDSVVAYWNQLGSDILLMIGPRGNSLHYPCTSRLVLHQEMDGLRIISREKHEFLQAVPLCTQRTFTAAVTTSPACNLYEARQRFDTQDPLADDLMREITDNPEQPQALQAAIDDCIEAAGHEWTSPLQRSLLKAARFGMDFSDVPHTSKFVEMCQYLRVLFHVRVYQIGIPLSFVELRALSMEVLIDRLIDRGLHWLAHEVCRFLRLDNSKAKNRVLVHWARNMILNSMNDDEVAEAIIEKIGDTKGVSYAEIAQAAITRKSLAIQLLDKEPRAAEQVPLLLQMNEDVLALTKAIQSGDTDLVTFVAMHLQEKLGSSGSFYRLINQFPVARDLFIKSCSPEDLESFFKQQDCRVELAALYLQQAYAAPLVGGAEARLDLLRQAEHQYTSKELAFHHQVTEDEIRLLAAQKAYEQQFRPKRFLGLSARDTVFLLITLGEAGMEAANKIKKDCKISDKVFWWAKVQALGASRNFAELERFAKSKKSPIGYLPFVEECITQSNRSEAAKYIPRLPVEQRVPFFLKIGDLEGAAEAATAAKSEELMALVRKASEGRQSSFEARGSSRA